MTNAFQGRPGRRIPQPAHPRRREVPLPWQTPKSGPDDPRAAERLQAILKSPSYVQTDSDSAFLERDDMRATRLQIDYLKPELEIQEQGIVSTIVVFGSTRLCDPVTAAARLAKAEADLSCNPDDARLHGRVAVAKSILAKCHYYETARAFGRMVGAAEGPHGRRIAVMTGGGPGMMEAANRGASETGARTIGLNITLPHEQFPNPYVTPELCFKMHYFALRKLHFLKRARALVAFPGGYGTFDELFETLTLVQTRKMAPLPIVLVGEAYWRRAFDVDFLVAEGTIDPEDRDLFWYAETANEIWDDIQHWYDKACKPLIP